MDLDTGRAIRAIATIAGEKRQALMEQMLDGNCSDYATYQKLVGMADAYADMYTETQELLKRIHTDGPEFQT